MQNIIKYVMVTLTIENLILKRTAVPYLSLIVGCLLFDSLTQPVLAQLHV